MSMIELQVTCTEIRYSSCSDSSLMCLAILANGSQSFVIQEKEKSSFEIGKTYNLNVSKALKVSKDGLITN